jgi:hypothetical protein
MQRRVGAELGMEVTCEVAEYPATLEREWWLEMVDNRFWSTFSQFSDAELAAGIGLLLICDAFWRLIFAPSYALLSPSAEKTKLIAFRRGDSGKACG